MLEKGNSKNFKLPDKSIKTYLLNDNLLRIMVKYCSFKEIINLSQVSKKFNKITKEMDIIYKDICNKVFCSNYMNYRYTYN